MHSDKDNENDYAINVGRIISTTAKLNAVSDIQVDDNTFNAHAYC